MGWDGQWPGSLKILARGLALDIWALYSLAYKTLYSLLLIGIAITLLTVPNSHCNLVCVIVFVSDRYSFSQKACDFICGTWSVNWFSDQ